MPESKFLDGFRVASIVLECYKKKALCPNGYKAFLLPFSAAVPFKIPFTDFLPFGKAVIVALHPGRRVLHHLA